MAQHYKQIVINLTCDDELPEVELQILKEKIEECINIDDHSADEDKAAETLQAR